MLQRNSSFVTTVWRVLPRQLELEQPVLLAEAQARLGFLRQRRIWQRRASTSCLFRTTEHFRAIGRRVPRSAFYLVTEDADALQLALEDGGL